MNSKDTDKNKIEKKTEGDRQVHITEEHLFELIERGSQKTAEECFKHFEKLHKEEMQFQHKVHLEDKEFEFKKEHEEREFKRKNLRIERWWRVFAIILAAAGFYLFWIGSIETEKATSQRAANQHKVDLIRADISEKKKMLQDGSIAISNLRTVSFEILLKCQYGHPYSMEEQKSIRWRANQKIIDTLRLSSYIFNEAVFKKAQEITFYSQNINDLCAYHGSFDDTVRKMQSELYNLENQAIQKDKKKIEDIDKSHNQ